MGRMASMASFPSLSIRTECNDPTDNGPPVWTLLSVRLVPQYVRLGVIGQRKRGFPQKTAQESDLIDGGTKEVARLPSSACISEDPPVHSLRPLVDDSSKGKVTSFSGTHFLALMHMLVHLSSAISRHRNRRSFDNVARSVMGRGKV
jgi:hypothetical protein